ncbi:hypothetical protein [Maribacter sp. 4G9]|uniref:hypothetical protein n=1 Tax=Flavobacteriaceae TaxID=49546 RepID=UPI000C14668C|nr:hypothetical protein [Maribacter sp. 4G9]PIB29396.1 hypothetical protein BFP75_03790 [Maribacter sp. 4G9]
MKSQIKLKHYLMSSVFSLFLMGCSAQKSIIPTKENVRSVNREIHFTEGVLELNAAEGNGMAILTDVSFQIGTIQLDIKGENNPGSSFVGIAFNIQNDSTYEAVYFRPFNFKSPEQNRLEHGIQYIFEPNYPWYRLRNENTGEFEAEFINPPPPDDWFSISLTIEKNRVIVKDSSGRLLMQVKRLSTISSSKIAFWVGNYSKGSFRNLKIQ